MSNLLERLRALVGDRRFLVALGAALGAAVTAFVAAYWPTDDVVDDVQEEQVVEQANLSDNTFEMQNDEVETITVTAESSE